MKTRSPKKTNPGLVHGYRSGLEDVIAAELSSRGVPFRYEAKVDVIPFVQPAKNRTYTPDFVLDNGVIIETKGRFVTADRQKHILIKAQHPELDIRFLFSNPNSRLSKLSKTTYGMWCEKNGFEYAKAATPAQIRKGANSIPQDWIDHGKT